MPSSLSLRAAVFLSPPSARRATEARCAALGSLEISIPALREEGDMAVRAGCCCSTYFYPRPPRGGRLEQQENRCVLRTISIPALREEGDLPLELALTLICDFYPRPPRGGRPAQRGKSSDWRLFLSTPSARRATSRRSPGRLRTTISIHALREEGDHDLPRYLPAVPISIHALREEGDLPPSREINVQSISIHALREEGDVLSALSSQPLYNFYPRPPRGGRPSGCAHGLPLCKNFYPRPPRGGRRSSASPTSSSTSYFYPRPPRGGRPSWWAVRPSARQFLSTPSARRATCTSFRFGIA